VEDTHGTKYLSDLGTHVVFKSMALPGVGGSMTEGSWATEPQMPPLCQFLYLVMIRGLKYPPLYLLEMLVVGSIRAVLRLLTGVHGVGEPTILVSWGMAARIAPPFL